MAIAKPGEARPESEKLQTPLQFLKGVGPKLAKTYKKLGLETVYDLLFNLPRDFEDRRQTRKINQLLPGQFNLIKGEVLKTEVSTTRNRFSILKALIGDESGRVQAVWFNQPYLLAYLKVGTRLIVSGKAEVSPYDGQIQLQVRDFEIDTGDNLTIVPKYNLAEGLYPKKYRAVLKSALDGYLKYLPDKKKQAALLSMHLPKDLVAADKARDYLAYDELLSFQLGLLLHRLEQRARQPGLRFIVDPAAMGKFYQQLHFKLTAAQERAVADIFGDFTGGVSMNRLLQGDVGSGKTIVAAAAAFVAVCNGYQAAILAPTEILAWQHYEKLCQLFGGLNCRVDVLTSTVSSEQKRAELQTADIIVGTHALLEEKVVFRKLGFIVIDEQHRFGVHQRLRLIKKGEQPHVLVMTATPIPRSLALTLYGELDRSVIDELPPGRRPVKTHFVPKNKRRQSYEFIREKLAAGRQAYIVCPLVEESAELDLKAAKAEMELLQATVFPEFKIGLIHGKLPGKEKDQIMKAFANRQIQVLVSTTVIEVGIDVPNATLMLIEQVERFGLSQLHQLRGRIGRGEEESYCFLAGNPKTAEAKSRVKAMLETTDGFAIAEIDLKLRGPGDFLGIRQSGLPKFRVADIIKDEKLLLQAREEAKLLIEKDPESARNRWESQRENFEVAKGGLGGSPFN